MAPRAIQICRNALTEANVIGSVDIRDFDLGFVALEKDLLSLEEDFGDYSQIFAVSFNLFFRLELYILG